MVKDMIIVKSNAINIHWKKYSLGQEFKRRKAKDWDIKRRFLKIKGG